MSGMSGMSAMSMRPTTDLATILENRSQFLEVTKAQAEFVVTRYQEDLAWTKGFEHLVTVYNKGLNDLDISGATFLSVPNFGAGLETVLRHIIMRYDSLAEVTMFCQGQIADRADQPLYPLEWYFDFTTEFTHTDPQIQRDHDGVSKKGVKGVLTDSYDGPRSHFLARISGDSCKAVRDRTLREFREKVVGIPYKYLVEFWVRGDWISVRRDVILKKGRDYYMYLYEACRFGRGIFVEECWFLERSLYSIFTHSLRAGFTYSCKDEKEVLLT